MSAAHFLRFSEVEEIYLYSVTIFLNHDKVSLYLNDFEENNFLAIKA